LAIPACSAPPAQGAHNLLLDRDLRAAVSPTLTKAYAAAKQVLTNNRHALDALAAGLYATPATSGRGQTS
jgi:hypothetical protein